MRLVYNAVAGQSRERLEALSDGIFAFAMTLLVLDLRVPAIEGIHDERQLLAALAALAPNVVTWLMSFMTLGIFWVGQQTQLDQLERTDRGFTWIHFVFLACVTLVPFSTKLLSAFITYRSALILYWLNILALGVMVVWSWRAARHRGLLKPGAEKLDRAVMSRVVIAQALYAAGAALCLINTYWSIGFIVLVQLNYAIAPRIRWLRDV